VRSPSPPLYEDLRRNAPSLRLDLWIGCVHSRETAVTASGFGLRLELGKPCGKFMPASNRVTSRNRESLRPVQSKDTLLSRRVGGCDILRRNTKYDVGRIRCLRKRNGSNLYYLRAVGFRLAEVVRGKENYGAPAQIEAKQAAGREDPARLRLDHAVRNREQHKKQASTSA
jgi:hypothetical protein